MSKGVGGEAGWRKVARKEFRRELTGGAKRGHLCQVKSPESRVSILEGNGSRVFRLFVPRSKTGGAQTASRGLPKEP
jgi:hypothetical protein